MEVVSWQTPSFIPSPPPSHYLARPPFSASSPLLLLALLPRHYSPSYSSHLDPPTPPISTLLLLPSRPSYSFLISLTLPPPPPSTSCTSFLLPPHHLHLFHFTVIIISSAWCSNESDR
ncbi:hypothetical protein Pmani_017473 [Petrolisthes manimaculis]|uniref:Uncharacterized protein n=1 Tax=Petrolisthes manimaculis TaxID=1843537 RepID=A0AAE1U9U0_9EUCA|nr:hypothetical protein Pmani_017473 [Petrolisthes manimaculis]